MKIPCVIRRRRLILHSGGEIYVHCKTMSSKLLKLSTISTWAKQLAGILPLLTLIEFIDVDLKLHLYELTGRVPLWNWPITPAGARLLLSSEDIQDACCLDRPSRSVALHCVDGKYGDLYPCSAPTTTRLCLSGKSDSLIRNECSHLTAIGARRQTLTVVHLTQVPGSTDVRKGFRIGNSRYQVVQTVGWLLWILFTFVALFSGQYYGLAYYLLMPTTGLVVRASHGHKARQLIFPNHPHPNRLVIVTDSLNASDWWAFYGKSGLINAILNKPLCRSTKRSASESLKWLTQLVIISQWVLAVGSCALQDWNALFISLWTVLCAFDNAYGYSPEKNVHDWLRCNCSVVKRQYQVELSSRRAMLSALVYINPDSRDGCTKWIDPILADAEDRRKWEAAILLCMEDDSKVDEVAKSQYWWKFILEGLDMGRKMEALLQDRSKLEA